APRLPQSDCSDRRQRRPCPYSGSGRLRRTYPRCWGHGRLLSLRLRFGSSRSTHPTRIPVARCQLVPWIAFWPFPLTCRRCSNEGFVLFFLRHARHEARIRDERCWQHAGCHEAVATSNKGEAYYGDATISGKPYPAGCELIKLRVPGKRSRASL